MRRGIPKGAGKSLGADKAWYRCEEVLRLDRIGTGVDSIDRKIALRVAL